MLIHENLFCGNITYSGYSVRKDIGKQYNNFIRELTGSTWQVTRGKGFKNKRVWWHQLKQERLEQVSLHFDESLQRHGIMSTTESFITRVNSDFMMTLTTEFLFSPAVQNLADAPQLCKSPPWPAYCFLRDHGSRNRPGTLEPCLILPCCYHSDEIQGHSGEV